VIRMEMLIAITVFIGLLLLILRAYCPNVWGFLESLGEFMASSVRATNSRNDSDIFEDSQTQGLWDNTSTYYSSLHDD